MATRRQERVARIVKEVVSDAITNHLNDPRIEGLVSVTRVDMAPDLRSADVYLSIFGSDPILPAAPTSVGRRRGRQKGAKWDPGKNETGQNKAFVAITHARNRIQTLLAGKLQSKFCPVLHFYKDEKFKKTLETMKLIDQAVSELKKKELQHGQDAHD